MGKVGVKLGIFDFKVFFLKVFYYFVIVGYSFDV